jgi:hypothetical protein
MPEIKVCGVQMEYLHVSEAEAEAEAEAVVYGVGMEVLRKRREG